VNGSPGRGLHLDGQLVLHLLPALLDVEGRLADEIDGAHLQGLEGHVRALLRQGRDHDHGHGAEPHDPFQERQAVQPGHFDIQGDHVRVEGLDLLARDQGIRGNADDLDLGIAGQELAQNLADERGIVDDQDSNHGALLFPCRPVRGSCE
jgi:hypothetical protein